MKEKNEIIVTFEMLGYKYGYPRIQMESEKNSVIELHYPIIYQLKREVKNTFSIYMIPKDVKIAKQKLKERNLPENIEKDRLKEIEEHIKNFNSNTDLRNQFDYIFYNDYTEKSVEKLVNVIKNKLLESKNINREWKKYIKIYFWYEKLGEWWHVRIGRKFKTSKNIRR